MSIWDFNDVEQSSQANAKPIWTLNLEDESETGEKEVLKWLVTEIERLRQDNRNRINEIQRHYKLYKGVSNDRLHRRNADRDDEYERVQIQRKVVINHLYDLTEQHVSRTAKYAPAVQFLPTNDEFHDKQAAKLAKRLFDHIKYVERLDDKVRKTTRYTKVGGEGYLFITWNPDKGEVSPAYQKALQEAGGEKIPQMDENGRPRQDDKGKTLYVEKEVRVGDVEYKIVRPEKLVFETRKDWDDVDYCFHFEEKQVDKVRADYPKRAAMIKPNLDERVEEYYDFTDKKNKSDTQIVTFYFKPSKYLAKGRVIKFTPETILESKPYTYDHKEWPFEMLSDIDIPGELHGRSFFTNARQITAQINNMTTMAVRNIKLCSAPKWFVPKGAVKMASLNNSTGIVQYQGGIAPQLMVPNTVAPEIFKIREELKQDVQQVSGVFGVSRGEPPAGVKAGVAMQFLNEQENERQTSAIAKYNEFIRRIASKTIKVCSQYYDESDERTISIIGKNDEYSRVPFDIKTLSRPFDVKIQNSSALPDSKAQKIQTVLDLAERFPGLVAEEQVADMIDIGQPEKWYDEATAATRTAERENEQLMDGERVIAEDYEYHLQHWRTHVTEIQKPGFRALPNSVQEALKDHVETHEMHMSDMAKKNPLYVQQLQILPQFPLFFVPDHMAPKISDEPVLDPKMEAGAMEQDMNAKMMEATETAKMDEEDEVARAMAAQEFEVQNNGLPPNQPMI